MSRLLTASQLGLLAHARAGAGETFSSCSIAIPTEFSGGALRAKGISPGDSYSLDSIPVHDGAGVSWLEFFCTNFFDDADIF